MSIQDATSSITKGFRTFRQFPQGRLEEVRVESRRRQAAHLRRLRILYPTSTTRRTSERS